MKLFLDTNVLLDVFLHREHEVAASAVIQDCITQKQQGWIAWHSLTNGYYLVYSETKSHKEADLFLSSLLSWAHVAPANSQIALRALDLDISDREDAFQVAAAEACGAEYIITRNIPDFKKSSVPVMTPEAFLQHLEEK